MRKALIRRDPRDPPGTRIPACVEESRGLIKDTFAFCLAGLCFAPGTLFWNADPQGGRGRLLSSEEPSRGKPPVEAGGLLPSGFGCPTDAVGPGGGGRGSGRWVPGPGTQWWALGAWGAVRTDTHWQVKVWHLPPG